MFRYLAIGGGFAFAAAVQPGPLQAFLLTRVAERGWRRTLPASLSPLLSDGPIALVVLLVLNRLPVTAGRVLQGAGGVLLLYLAIASLRRAKRVGGDGEDAVHPPRTLFQAALVNLLNPNPYLGWSLVLGPTAMKAWGEAPALAVALVAAFYVTLVAGLALTIVLFGTTGFLRPSGRRNLVIASAVALAAIGVYQLAAALVSGAPG